VAGIYLIWSFVSVVVDVFLSIFQRKVSLIDAGNSTACAVSLFVFYSRVCLKHFSAGIEQPQNNWLNDQVGGQSVTLTL